jgi:uncharacterized protein
MTRRLRTLALGTAALFAALLALAAPALAHVTVSAPGATPGGSDQQITFRVPVEEKSPTVAFTVALPTDHPIASVLVATMPGWTHTEQTAHLATPIKTDDGEITTAVSQITWTATSGNGLQPGEYGSFTVLAGQLPDVPTLTFKAVQTYANGDVVRWIEVPAPGSDSEPEHPAPVLRLGAPSATDAGQVTASAQPAASSSDTGAIVLAVIALVLAAAALGLAVVTRARTRTGGDT